MRLARRIDPRSLPLTGLANAAIDRIAPARETCVANLANYALGDLACYRADGPPDLVARQAELWDALLAGRGGDSTSISARPVASCTSTSRPPPSSGWHMR